jgi:hypothetical protein
MKVSIHQDNQPTKLMTGSPLLVLAQHQNNIQMAVDSDAEFAPLMEMLFTAVLRVANKFSANNPERKPDIYDVINILASSTLATFMPDNELRPDLTAEALLNMENQVLEAYANAKEETDNTTEATTQATKIPY